MAHDRGKPMVSSSSIFPGRNPWIRLQSRHIFYSTSKYGGAEVRGWKLLPERSRRSRYFHGCLVPNSLNSSLKNWLKKRTASSQTLILSHTLCGMAATSMHQWACGKFQGQGTVNRTTEILLYSLSCRKSLISVQKCSFYLRGDDPLLAFISVLIWLL